MGSLGTSLPLPRQFRRWLMSSPPVEWVLAQLRLILIGALRQGPMPRHVAFVMDGNRRFARSHGLEAIEGHNLGFEALARTLDVCYQAGVTTVTCYAFSTENFKRSKAEVNALMDMAKVKLTQLSQHGDVLQRYGVRMRFLGSKGLLRKDVLEKIEEAVAMTSNNTTAVLNICAPYTSREEIASAMRRVIEDWSVPLDASTPTQLDAMESSGTEVELEARRLMRQRRKNEITAAGLDDGDTGSAASSSPSTLVNGEGPDPLHHTLTPSHSHSTNSTTQTPAPAPAHVNGVHTPSAYPPVNAITADTLSERMFTADSPPLDILVRTSGVERLSDFMLWQCHQHTSIYFLSCMWPEFDLWHFLPVLVEWQYYRRRELRALGLDENGAGGGAEIPASLPRVNDARPSWLKKND